jgi:exodeoxyribonuclease X
MSKTIIFDTEATGIKEPVLIEAAWLELESIDPLLVANPFVQRYNPGKPITLGALATHHIMDEELVDSPPASSFSLPDDVSYIIGHNVDFDCEVIGKPQIKRICTLALARKLWPDLDSHTQSTLLYYLERNSAREQLRNAHSALTDVGICAVILDHICQQLNIKTVEDLYTESEKARIPTTMPFGKHKGLALTEIPGDYVRWLLDQQNIDPYLRQAFMALKKAKS